MAVIKRNGVTYGGNSSINLAPQYSNFATYAVGDYVMMDGLLRRCITAITTPEDFDSDKWTIVNVTGEIDNIESSIPAAVTVTNTGDVYIGSQLIRKVLTQAEYDLLDPPDPKVDYLIVPAST